MICEIKYVILKGDNLVEVAEKPVESEIVNIVYDIKAEAGKVLYYKGTKMGESFRTDRLEGWTEEEK